MNPTCQAETHPRAGWCPGTCTFLNGHNREHPSGPPLGDNRSMQVRRADGVQAMRALAHPLRVRIRYMLAAEPLSASELARRLGIRAGSAQYHLRTLVRAGIAVPAGERMRRGGRELLYRVPAGTGLEVSPETPAGLRGRVDAAYVAEVQRLLDASLQVPPGAADETITTIREVSLTPDAMPAAQAAIHELLAKLRALDNQDAKGATPNVLSLFWFRIPAGASRRQR
jgi:DNA-binding transcriptional ArsR family regulator